jgi:hypothetical protein
MALQSNTDIRLLKGLLLGRSAFSLSLSLSLFSQFIILHLLIFSLIRSIPLSSEAAVRFSTSLPFYGDGLSAFLSNPKLKGQFTVFVTPGQGGPVILPGTGCKFWSPFTTCLGCSWTYFPWSSHAEGWLLTSLQCRRQEWTEQHLLSSMHIEWCL